MRILVVEDEIEISKMVRLALGVQGFLADQAPTIEFAVEALETADYDAIILDRKLGDGDGLSIITNLRARGIRTPVLVLSARKTVDDKIEGLASGADDYLQKPFVVDELIARLRAILRRSPEIKTSLSKVGHLTYEIGTGTFLIGEIPLALPRREHLLLETLMRRPGIVVRRELLIESVYGVDDDIVSNSLDAHVSRLRRKLDEGNAGVEIHTVRGLGYLIRAPHHP